ncbi:MAG: tetratricopeptide repeat protein [Anaerolineae bacterium]|nr:tetratricopeptide repeat protein [Thermoflexales bacterium]MDW8406871.1 tetratricopeptide repeat protein [Anaerolineae bacterium]
MSHDTALEAFAAEVNRPEQEIDLARAALVMGAFEYPGLPVEHYLRRLDELAAAAQPALSAADLPSLALAQYLFKRLGFTGNQDDYLDPRNSFLNQVLDRRLGIPITLSLLYIEVAHRMGIDAEGVGLPGHFIVRSRVESGSEGAGSPEHGAEVIYLDPFHGGALMEEADCAERVRAITGGKLPFSPQFLSPVGARYILNRMLNNLKNAYASRQDLQRALRVVERLLVLNPNDPEETRNLGLLHAGLGHTRQAIAALSRYLELRPDAADAPAIRAHITALGGRLARWN